jgi:RNA polymerase sigma-70 factor (ECF subfamily)
MQSVHRSLLIGLRDAKIDLRSPQALVGLAAVMVRRKVARKWRRMRRQHRLSGVASETNSGDLPDVMASLGAPSRDPARLAQLREQFAEILSRLDESDRELIRLRIDGYRTVDAAGVLGISPDVARVRLSRLRKKLQEAHLDDALL